MPQFELDLNQCLLSYKVLWYLHGACCAVKPLALPSLQRLAEWVAIQSVSAWPEKRGEIKHMMEVAAKEIERLGGTTKLMDIGKQKVCEHLHGSLVGKNLFRAQGVLHD